MTRRWLRRRLDSCRTRFLVSLLVVCVIVSAAEAGVTEIYWISHNEHSSVIRRFNLDGTGLESILTGLPDPWHAALQVDGPVALKTASWGRIKSDYYSAGE
jgi:hypothetical protein